VRLGAPLVAAMIAFFQSVHEHNGVRRAVGNLCRKSSQAPAPNILTEDLPVVRVARVGKESIPGWIGPITASILTGRIRRALVDGKCCVLNLSRPLRIGWISAIAT